MKLVDHRLVQVVWCDDIRQEVGNKPSFMGVYTNAMVVPSVPSVIQKLCAWIHIFTPIATPFESLKVRVCSNDSDTSLAEIEMDSAQLLNMTTRTEAEAEAAAVVDPDAPRALGIQFVMVLGPLQITEATKWLVVKVDCESEIFESFKLRICTSHASVN